MGVIKTEPLVLKLEGSEQQWQVSDILRLLGKWRLKCLETGYGLATGFQLKRDPF